jgi:putative CocE/NonD family hydrolase
MKFRVLLVSCVLLLSATLSVIQAQTEAEVQAKYTKTEQLITMSDGVRLFTSIYTPKDTSRKYAIMLNRTPYSVAPYGPSAFRSVVGPSLLFQNEGFIFVYQDVRGRNMSGGEFEDVRPYIPGKRGTQIDETSDTWDTVDWLIKNLPNHNGRVGVWGISYPGFYTSMAGIDNHPAVKAISPQAPVSDWFTGDDMHHNGAVFLAQNYRFFARFGQQRPRPTATSDYLKTFTFGTQDGYKYFLQMGGLANSGDIYERQLGLRIKFWDQMMAHPNYDQFWKDRNILPKLKNITTAVMTVGGWYDNEDLYGALETYRHIERQNPGIFNVLVMGPWFHGGWSRSDGDWLGTAYFGEKTGVHYREHFEVTFFNHFLYDKGDIKKFADVNVFDTGANRWREYSSWNPAASIERALYLTENGGLTFIRPSGSSRRGGYDEYVSDPMNPVPYTQKIAMSYPRDFMTEDQRFVAGRPDVLVYESLPLREELTVVGDVKPELFISSSGTDSDFIVKLIDVFPDDYQYPPTGRTLADGEVERLAPPADSAACVFEPGGYQMLLRAEPFPARFRNSFETPVPLKPNQPTKIAYVMPGLLHTFRKGHRIMIQIQSTWFPLVARNPQKFMPNYKAGTDGDFQKATQRVYRSGQYNSRVMLRTIR